MLMYCYNNDYFPTNGGSIKSPPAQELDREERFPSGTSFPGQGNAKETENDVAKGGSVSPTGEGITVFIDAAPEDAALASQMENALQANQISYFSPLDVSSKPTKIINNLERNLRECKVVLLINDRVPQAWVNERLRHYSRTFILRNQPIEKVIIYKPAQDKRSFKGSTFPDKTKIEECSSPQECLTLLLAN